MKTSTAVQSPGGEMFLFFWEANMYGNRKKAFVVAGAILVGLGALRFSPAATVIDDKQTAQVEGWNITAPTGVALTVTSSGNGVFIENAANFTEPDRGFQVAFQPVARRQSGNVVRRRARLHQRQLQRRQ